MEMSHLCQSESILQYELALIYNIKLAIRYF